MDNAYEQAAHSRGNLNGQQTNEKILNLTGDREMHIKTIRHHFPRRLAKIKETDNIKG